MAKARKGTDLGNDGILDLLTPERRRQVLDEALGAQLRALVEKHSRGTLGELVDALRKDKRWSSLQAVRVSTVLRGGAAPTGGRRGRASRIDASFLDRLHGYIAKNPGRRSEEIQANFDADRRAVKTGLAKLRELKRVKTQGEKRATTYTAV